jgi:hypothetical protein
VATSGEIRWPWVGRNRRPLTRVDYPGKTPRSNRARRARVSTCRSDFTFTWVNRPGQLLGGSRLP